jgi:uncharacterized protein (TIGR03435 family)
MMIISRSQKKLSRIAAFLMIAATPALGRTQTSSTVQQPAASVPEFEVATIKPGNAAATSDLGFNGRDHFVTSNIALQFILQFAYGLNSGSDRQIIGGPAWIESSRFTIDAQPDEAVAAELKKLPLYQRQQRQKLMIQRLLADRFKLVLHHETREFPINALMIAKGGAKLTPVTVDFAMMHPTPDGWMGGLHNPRPGLTEGRAATIKMLVDTLNRQPELSGRLIVDATGLQGNYDFNLSWTPDRDLGAAPAEAVGPSLFTALQEQLGLKIESRKAAVDCIVIDHVEKPSAN